MNVKVTFDGKNFADALTKKLEAKCEQAIKMIAMKIEADAKELCPVDTGRLRDSIDSVFSSSNGNWTAEIGTDVEYAYYIEYGTGKYNPDGRKDPWVYQSADGSWHFTEGMKAQPFLYPAFNQNRKFIEQYLRDRISKVLGG